MILSFDDEEDVLAFVGGHQSPQLSQIGAACPDHLVHTKVVPLFIDWTPNADDVEGLRSKLVEGIALYKEQYQAYFERNRHEGDVMFEA
ncbi:bifunctional rhamnulose-1-phosphate aldolase/short-chain dehydrogenase, partial [Peribacillus sp. NPDC056705]